MNECWQCQLDAESELDEDGSSSSSGSEVKNSEREEMSDCAKGVWWDEKAAKKPPSREMVGEYEVIDETIENAAVRHREQKQKKQGQPRFASGVGKAQ